MSDYWLCDAGDRLFSQVNRRWPKRGHASDGWIGDASHQAAVSDHNPCWTCTGERYGVVRAIDIDASLTAPDAYNYTNDSWDLANQLRNAMVKGDDRISYVIAWDPTRKQDYIASLNPAYQPLGRWREYTGDSHINHIHVSFTPLGDFRGVKFDLPIFENATVPERLLEAKDTAARHIKKALRALARWRKERRRIKARIKKHRNH